MTPQFWAQTAKKKKVHLPLIPMVEMAGREGIVGEIRISVEHVLSLWYLLEIQRKMASKLFND